MKKILFKRIININNFFVYYFNKLNELIKIINSKFKKISNFNKYLIFLITFLFLYLFYLSIPSLYNKVTLQTKLNKILNDEYNINISLSSDLNYNILPKPHIKIENAKFYSNNLDLPKELGQIKNFKIFISQKNFFNQDGIKIKKIILDEANFSLQSEDLKYLNEFFKKRFSKKKLEINRSKVFYVDGNNSVVSIFPIKKSYFFYDEKNFKNSINLKGKFFTIPYVLNWNKDFNNNLYSTLIKLNKLNLKIKNLTKKKNSGLLIKNLVFFRNLELETDILLKNNSIDIKSVKDTKTLSNRIHYSGKIDLEPFNFQMDINLDETDFKKNFFNNNFIRSILELKNLYNENLSSKINLNILNLKNNKLFSSSKIFIDLNNGELNFDNSFFDGKAGTLKLINSSIGNFKEDLIFTGNFKYNVLSIDEFNRLFQVTKKNRKKINNVYFDIQLNLTKNKFQISNLVFDPGKIKYEDDLLIFLEENSLEGKINNWIDFKNFVNRIFVNYYEG